MYTSHTHVGALDYLLQNTSDNVSIEAYSYLSDKQVLNSTIDQNFRLLAVSQFLRYNMLTTTLCLSNRDYHTVHNFNMMTPWRAYSRELWL